MIASTAIAFIDYFRGLPALDKIFFLCAFGGGLLFIARLVLAFVGGEGHDADVPDTEIHVDTDTGVDSTHSFKVLTIQGITGFFMMFGLVGLAISRGTHWKLVSIGGAFVAGLATVWILDRTFQAMRGIQSSGTLRPELAVGQEGTVYLTIHGGRPGKVQVAVHQRLREFNAISPSGDEIATGERIRVVRVLDGNVLAVERVSPGED